jgi:hypothetical protein
LWGASLLERASVVIGGGGGDGARDERRATTTSDDDDAARPTPQTVKKRDLMLLFDVLHTRVYTKNKRGRGG